MADSGPIPNAFCVWHRLFWQSIYICNRPQPALILQIFYTVNYNELWIDKIIFICHWALSLALLCKIEKYYKKTYQYIISWYVYLFNTKMRNLKCSEPQMNISVFYIQNKVQQLMHSTLFCGWWAVINEEEQIQWDKVNP